MAALQPPATPQRTAPGSFINTPGPIRPASHRIPSQSQITPQPATLTPIERAARTVNSMLDKDANSRDLETYLGQGVSGEYDLGTSTAFAPFQELNLYQIPAEVMDQVNEVQISTRMGLLAEINHAWVAVDNQLYLWDYTASSPELKGYEQNPNTIISVKLVKPRPQVFQDVISYLLVVATTQEVLLIGVQCERGPEGVHSVQLYETNLAVTVRGILVGPIIGSPRTGRIFFADGRDSEDVYELNYQQEDRWFSSRCSKTNHVKKAITLPALPFYSSTNSVYITQMEVDDTRNVLYTLSSNGTIRVFHMKTATTLDQVITLRMPTLKQNCSHMVGRQAEMLKDLTISGISTITASEATNLSLVATTSNGVRIYLSTTSSGYYSDPTAAPTSIQVRHMRFPPLENQGANQSPSNQVQSFQNTTPVGFDSQYLSKTFKAFRFAPGSFFCFVSKGDNNASHMLFMSAPHVGQATQQEQAQAQRFRENAQALDLRGLVQDVGLATEPFSAAGRPLGFGNELAVQFDKPPCEYAILTHNGIKTVRRRRLVDIFATIIKDGGGPDGIQANLNEIARQYGKAEMASTALAVACGQGSDSNANRSSDPEVLDLARKAFIEEGGRAQLDQNAPTVEGLSVDNVRASPRHDGIAMYVSRLVRSIWRSPIVREAKGPNGLVLLSTHKITKLQSIQRALIELQRFLDLNKVDIEGLNGPDAMGRLSSRQEELVLQGENRALTSLLQLINNIIEGISFVLVLLDERLEDITKLLPVDSQAKVRQLTFEGLFSVRQGKDLAKELVKAIVSLNIAKGSNVETVAEGLRRKCGSFCSSDDVVIFKAQENLKKAADAGANAERGRLLLNDSMRLFEQVASSLSEEHLNLAMSQYIELEFYAGAIRLALKVAQELDRGNIAISWIKDGRPEQDAREIAYDQRRVCYEHIFKVIEAVDRAYNSQPVVQEGVISQITRRRQEAYTQINESEDEVFQNYLYDWYLSKGWADRLLEIQSPFVIDYLRRSSATEVSHADLLWRYYAHYGDFLSAAEVQMDLAKSEVFKLSLEKRIEYLSRAKANASTRITGFTDTGARNRQSRQELLKNINEYLDIANIQDDVLQEMKSDSRLEGERRLTVLGKLDGPIRPLQELFQQYADQAGYYGITLLIFHSADFRNLPDIRSTWTNLVNQVHTKAVDQGHQAPWELVAYEVEHIGRRVNLNENIFPVNTLLILLLQYDLTYYTHDTPPAGTATPDLIYCGNMTWAFDTLIKLGASFELMVATLEQIWYAQEHPFIGRNRKLLIEWFIYCVEQWADASRRQGLLFGGEENAIGLAEVLRVVLGSGELGKGPGSEQAWQERGRVMQQLVDEVTR